MVSNLPLIITFTGYLCITLLIGLCAYRATESFSDYMLGGRQLGTTVTALSVCASDMSGWLLLALPGAIYLRGLSEVWLGVGLWLGALVNWQFIAKRLRVYSVTVNNALTIPDYLEKRLEDHSGSIRLIAAATILLFFIFYTASGLVGGALLFSEIFGMPYLWALVIGSSVIILYTFAGGFLAVSWTDVFQGILMLLALLIVPATVLLQLHDANPLQVQMNTNEQMLNILDGLTPVAAISFLAWGLGYTGQPHILARFMAIKSPTAIPVSRNIAMSWQTLALAGACLVGLSGALYYHQQPLSNPETVFIHLSNAVFSPWVAGFLIAAIMSAIMSTVDSQLLVCSSALSEDFYKRWIKTQASEKELLWVSRIAVALVALAAMWCASDPQRKILDLVSYAWAGLGATFGPLIAISLYWSGLTRKGAFAGMVLGALTVIIWSKLTGDLFEIYELFPGFVLSALTIFFVSRVDSQKPSESTLKTFSLMEKSL